MVTKDILNNLLLIALIMIVSFIIGIIFEKVIITKLKTLTSKTKWKGDDIIVNALGKHILLWFILAGVMIAIDNVSLKKENIDILDKVILVIFVFSITIVFSKILTGFVELSIKKTKAVFPSTSIFTNLTKISVFIIGGLIVLDALHISITPILTALGVGGLAVALALQDTLSNLFSGIQIIASNQVRIGDYVRLSTGEEGYVIDVTWRNTTIRSLSNNVTIIPNSKLANTILVNFNMPEKELSVLVEMGVSYSSDLEKVEKVTIEVAREIMKTVPGGVADFEPFIRYHTFGDSSINFTVILRGKEFTAQYIIKHEFIKRLFDRYNKEGIKIPFPTRTVYLTDKD